MNNRSYGMGPPSDEYGADCESQLAQEDTLIDRHLDDALDEGISPPERLLGRGAFGPLENMDQMLAEEESDPASRVNVPLDEDEQQRSDEAEREAEFPRRDEVGRVRAGRLVAPDRGFGDDEEAELVADDVGISGGAASAEEAAVHIIDDEE
ncbi:MAG TPA: DUF5709 domain-containing protein [Mycobacterium sp.]|nr:DUF5709 domain-containing protein [Mycobacterium sp.]